jgi:hypothetical protein
VEDSQGVLVKLDLREIQEYKVKLVHKDLQVSVIKDQQVQKEVLRDRLDQQVQLEQLEIVDQLDQVEL